MCYERKALDLVRKSTVENINLDENVGQGRLSEEITLEFQPEV